MDSHSHSQDPRTITTSGHHGSNHSGVYVCCRCGWPFTNPHPSARHRRAHKRICGNVEGYKLIDSQLSFSDDEHLSDDEHKTSSPKLVKKSSSEFGSGGIGGRSNRSEDDLFSDVVMEFSDTGPSPGIEERMEDARESVSSKGKIVDDKPITTLSDKDIAATEEMDMVASSIAQTRERRMKHYSSSHKILLVGEGDFSFSVSLANAFGSAVNMVATSLDSREMLLSKYSMASYNLRRLEELGCTLIHEVDVRTMAEHPLLAHKVFDKIVFNFPHAGFKYSEEDDYQISLHQGVLIRFFRSARRILTRNGEIHVTHKTAHPFNKWEIVKLAEDFGLSLVEKAYFSKLDYPGYDNKRGSGSRSNETFSVGTCRTFKFVISTEVTLVECLQRQLERLSVQLFSKCPS